MRSNVAECESRRGDAEPRDPLAPRMRRMIGALRLCITLRGCSLSLGVDYTAPAGANGACMWARHVWGRHRASSLVVLVRPRTRACSGRRAGPGGGRRRRAVRGRFYVNGALLCYRPRGSRYTKSCFWNVMKKTKMNGARAALLELHMQRNAALSARLGSTGALDDVARNARVSDAREAHRSAHACARGACRSTCRQPSAPRPSHG